MGKRLAALAVFAGLAASLLTASAAEGEVEVRVPTAPEGAMTAEILILEEETDRESETAALLAEPDWEGAIQALRAGIVAREERISLREFNIPRPTSPDMAELQPMFHHLRYRYGELFAFSGGVNFYANSTILTACSPTYTMEADEYAQARDFYRQELEAIVAQVPEGSTDLEKVLFIHDYLATHYEYDYEHDNDHKNYDAYSFFRDGKGVCQAYMLVFSDLMRELDVPVSYVSSDCINHTWNMVELDGTWYNVDVTWDDPAIGDSSTDVGADVLGAAGHTNFLISDATCEALRRKYATQIGWKYADDWVRGEDVTCPDKRYESSPIAAADSPMVYLPEDESWYYLSTDKEDKGLYRWTGEGESVRVEDYSADYAGGVAPLCQYRGCLFYADAQRVYRYEVDTGKRSVLFSKPASASALSGIRVSEGVLSFKDRATGVMTEWDGELLPWRDGPGGLVSCYYYFGAVDLRLSEDVQGQLLLAWYDAKTGRMEKLSQVREDGTYGVAVEDKGLACSLFLLSSDGGWKPLFPKFAIHP